MTTSFPTGLDALTNPTGSSSLTSPDHAGQHADINDAVEALEAKVGINSSAVTSSLDYKITNINASNLASGTVPSARVAGAYTGVTSVGTLGSLTVTGDVTVDTNTLKVDSTNNRVGIANASPAYTLDVNGTVEATQYLQGTDYLSPYQGFRNHLINGGFDVWQRGTSSASTGVVTADRWYNVTSGTTTFSQDTSDFPTGVGVMYSNKWTTSAASSFGQIFQTIESSTIRRLRGSTVTLSGWVKRSATWTGSLYFVMFYSTSSDAYSSQTIQFGGTSDQIIPTTSWVRYSTTFTVPSNAAGLMVGIVPTNVQASGTVVYFAGMQLERGSVATPFEQRPMQTELALCQRYFQKSYLQGVFPNAVTDAGMTAFYGSTGGFTTIVGTVQLKVTMRVAPTTITYHRSDGGGTGGNWFTSTGGGIATPATIYAGDSSFSFYHGTNGANLVGGMYGHWTASAEL